MSSLLIATVLFLATHFVPSTPLRPALVKAMGEWPYRGRCPRGGWRMADGERVDS